MDRPNDGAVVDRQRELAVEQHLHAANETARNGVPTGAYVRSLRCCSAAVGPFSSAVTATPIVEPGRCTATSCSPWMKYSWTPALAGAAGRVATANGDKRREEGGDQDAAHTRTPTARAAGLQATRV
jgi:hypothetical protein